MVSMGALEKGPIAPEMSPMIIVCQEGSSASSGWCFFASFLSSWYAVKFAPWFVAWRSAVSETPRYSVARPSSRTIVYAA